MEFYIFLFLISIFFIDIRFNLFNIKIASTYWFFFLFIVLIVGLRYKVGADWDAYIDYYSESENSSFQDYILTSDIAYSSINWLFNRIGLNQYYVNLLCAFIFLYGIFKICEHLKWRFVAIPIAMSYAIIVVGMNYTRQSAAIGLFFYFLYIYIHSPQKKLQLFLIFLTACLFHKTLIFISPILFFLFNKNFDFKKIILFLGVLSLGSLYFLFYDFSALLSLYVDNEEMTSAGALYRLILNFIPILIFSTQYRLGSVNDNYFSKILVDRLLFISVFLIVLSFIVPTISDRLGLYFSFVQFVFWPKIIENLKSLYLKIIALILILSLYFLMLYTWLVSGNWSSYWISYKNILTI